MKNIFQNKLQKFLLWRVRNMSDRVFMTILALIVGIAVGLAAVIMKTSVHLVRELVIRIIDTYNVNYLFFIFPAVGILLTLIFVKTCIKKKLGHGIPMVLYNMSQNEGKIPKHNMFSRIIGSSLTVGFGGSVGLEGPIVATGSAIGSNIGQLFRLKYKQIILLIACAATGAIASIFKAPIAGIIFSMEVMMLDLSTASLLPLLAASISATLTSYMFLGLGVVYPIEHTDPFVMNDIGFLIVFGILCGIVSLYFSKLYLSQNNWFAKIKTDWVKFLVGAGILGLLIFLFPTLYGEGFESINAALKGDYSILFTNTFYSQYSFMHTFWGITIILVLTILLKVFATGCTFGAGGAGGIFAPSLFLGAILGLLFANVCSKLGFSISVGNYALIGMAGLIGGIMHAPFTAIFLIAELTGGYSLFVALMIVSTISFFVTRAFMPNSVYTILLAKRGELLTHNADRNMLAMMKMEQYIEKNFLTIHEDANLRDLTDVISRSTRTVYVVVDSNDNFKGLVWLDEIKHLIFKTELYDSTKVKDLMFYPSTTVEYGMSVQEVAELFENSDNYNIVVIDKGKYVGFVSRATIFSEYRQKIKEFAND
ncbi:MAG: chloride channel protein [Bacteroidales bacterium]|nr:chloride channel protein [Bacteroidales bacterium]